MLFFIEQIENIGIKTLCACIEDLGLGDFVKIDCAACGHMALLTPAFLSLLGLNPRGKVLDLKDRVRCRGCGARGRAVVSIKWAKSAAWFRLDPVRVGLRV